MVHAGWFESSKMFYTWKVVSLLSMFLSVAAVLLHGRHSWTSCIAAGCLLGITWQQCGWLSHDFLHHQVFKGRRLNNAAGYIFGCLLQGFSVDWWKSKHNVHHAVPNECTGDGIAVDPGTFGLCVCEGRECSNR
jgi:acyl-lipid Delta6-acetylenase / acyl-lipid (9-3)-desaturase